MWGTILSNILTNLLTNGIQFFFNNTSKKKQIMQEKHQRMKDGVGYYKSALPGMMEVIEQSHYDFMARNRDKMRQLVYECGLYLRKSETEEFDQLYGTTHIDIARCRQLFDRLDTDLGLR